LYIPTEIITKKDSVLVVTSAIRTGCSKAALVNLVHNTKAELSGIFSIAAVGEEWKSNLKPRTLKAYPLMVLREKKQPRLSRRNQA
jgi:adenine/guanine phosphoribosyltransferase-like PRPP-binding protein